jgi:hypothetical protein
VYVHVGSSPAHRVCADRGARRRVAAAGARVCAAARAGSRAGRALEPLNEDLPLVPAAAYGLRAWSVVGERGDELLVGAYQAAPWPPEQWLEATCRKGKAHSAPGHNCTCGIYALHPRPRTARRVLSVRGRVGGIVEAAGALEVYEEGFRAERARPYALMVGRRYPALVRRLAERYGAEVIDSSDPQDLIAFCRERGLGFDRGVVRSLIGADELERQRQLRLERTRRTTAQITTAVMLMGTLVRVGRSLGNDQ